jgi:hypothetical protein
VCLYACVRQCKGYVAVTVTPSARSTRRLLQSSATQVGDDWLSALATAIGASPEDVDLLSVQVDGDAEDGVSLYLPLSAAVQLKSLLETDTATVKALGVDTVSFQNVTVARLDASSNTTSTSLETWTYSTVLR